MADDTRQPEVQAARASKATKNNARPDIDQALAINEIFYSIQGESTRAGRPCVFIRLMGCHLRCHYCDTAYAFFEGKKQTIRDIVAEAEAISHGCELYEITGGEPLLQPAVHDLMARLADLGKTVLIETSGACDINGCDPRVIRIMDLKTPDSGEVDRNLMSNLDHLTERDEVKFVLCSRGDYEWARQIIEKHHLATRVGAILMSSVHEVAPGEHIQGTPGLPFRDLAEWILADHLPVTLQTQLHKLIWHPMQRGV